MADNAPSKKMLSFQFRFNYIKKQYAHMQNKIRWFELDCCPVFSYENIFSVFLYFETKYDLTDALWKIGNVRTNKKIILLISQCTNQLNFTCLKVFFTLFAFISLLIW